MPVHTLAQLALFADILFTLGFRLATPNTKLEKF
jgi:hypothetical protein